MIHFGGGTCVNFVMSGAQYSVCSQLSNGKLILSENHMWLNDQAYSQNIFLANIECHFKADVTVLYGNTGKSLVITVNFCCCLTVAFTVKFGRYSMLGFLHSRILFHHQLFIQMLVLFVT